MGRPSEAAVTRILLVEGDETQARRMDDSLSLHPGWEIVRAGTLLEAIRAAGESHFEAAVLNTELPDGSGLDILDFLRIGSPGIRIVLLADKPSESVAFHALSHGAGDFIVKDLHLDEELPRRIDALLDHHEPMSALVETLTPTRRYDEQLFQTTAPAARSTDSLGMALDELVGGNVLAAGVWDLRGRAIATKVTKDMDGDGMGFAMATLHGQVGALWTYGNMKPTGYRLLIDVEGGLLAVTAIPGTFIVALLFDAGFAPRRALEKIDAAGMRVLAAMQGGSSGSDLSAP